MASCHVFEMVVFWPEKSLRKITVISSQKLFVRPVPRVSKPSLWILCEWTCIEVRPPVCCFQVEIYHALVTYLCSIKMAATLWTDSSIAGMWLLARKIVFLAAKLDVHWNRPPFYGRHHCHGPIQYWQNRPRWHRWPDTLCSLHRSLLQVQVQKLTTHIRGHSSGQCSFVVLKWNLHEPNDSSEIEWLWARASAGIPYSMGVLKHIVLDTNAPRYFRSPFIVPMTWKHNRAASISISCGRAIWSQSAEMMKKCVHSIDCDKSQKSIQHKR